MSKIFDVVVLGLGAHGSSAAYHLSRAGCNVLGLDQYRPPHTNGSSHGQSRIIRQAYHEGPLYVPFVKEAYKLWDEIERATGKKLFLKTGGIMLGAKDSSVVMGSRLSVETHHIPFEYLDSIEIEKKFPAFNPPRDTYGVLEYDAGILFPEECIKTHLEEAEKNGAALRYNESVNEVKVNENSIEIITGKNSYHAAKLIVSAGTWLNQLFPELRLPLTIERQVLYWFKNTNEDLRQFLAPDAFPIYIWEYLPGKVFYGFPDLGDGIKIAFYNGGRHITADEPNPAATEQEISSITAIAKEYLRIEPTFNYCVACKYTNTPDENFIIDFHPDHKNIIIASPCSGHGFKFSSATGKILSDMATAQPLSFDLSPFSISRFA